MGLLNWKQYHWYLFLIHSHKQYENAHNVNFGSFEKPLIFVTEKQKF